MPSLLPELPVNAVMPDILATLELQDNLILQAQTGSGKTTRVPLALLDAIWLGEQKILMLEPRRLATRAAAEYMASLLDQQVGQTVGYRVRLENRVSRDTRLEIITEGILTRMLCDNPALEGVGLLIFDEFHERSLDADLALGLLLHNRELLREGPPLKLLAMSATLAMDGLAALLEPYNNHQPVTRINADGRSYPVDISYASFRADRRQLVARCVAAINETISRESGNLLVFLPGVAEITAVEKALAGTFINSPLLIVPLHGKLAIDQQRLAIQAPPAGIRKVVLTTNVAETSLTIDGISIVIDGGFQRSATFDPRTGMTRLHTMRISRASATQRTGRAGRVQAGKCFRLWTEEEQSRLLEHSPPEILQADLAPLALQLIQNDIDDPAELAWLDPPPLAAFAQARELLLNLQAIEKKPGSRWRLSLHGRAMVQLPLHPRIAHMVIRGRELQVGSLACHLAALLTERDPLAGSAVDIRPRLELLCMTSGRSGHSSQFGQIRQQAKKFAVLANISLTQVSSDLVQKWCGILLALAYPDRIARCRNRELHYYQLSNGRSAILPALDNLAREEWLVCADLGGKTDQSRDIIYRAAPLEALAFEQELASLLITEDSVSWDKSAEKVRCESRTKVGAITVTSRPLSAVNPALISAELLRQIRRRGLAVLPWTDASRQLVQRVELLRLHYPSTLPGNMTWPNLSPAGLLDQLESWLAPFLGTTDRLEQLARLDLHSCLSSLLPWPLPTILDQLAPTHITVPSGSNLAIDYGQTPPVLAVKLQEMFGCRQTPSVANGQCLLLLHLLSPARRPLQLTQDLAGFWSSSYIEVKKEMKGRYPRHPWPDDPANAVATRHTNKRTNQS